MNMGDDLRHQFVRLSYSPEIMSMEFIREELTTIYDYIKSKEQEIERLNNIINETKKGLDKYYKEHSRLRWTEEDYIEFINCIDRELKGVDKE